MKNYSVPCFALFLFLVSCESTKEETITWTDITVSGEFLFEGPNTLQGQTSATLKDLLEDKDFSAETVTSATLKSATVTFQPDSLRPAIESALLQFVSDNLELTSVATLNPIPEDGTVTLQVTEETDILEYLKDPSTSIILDVNLDQDLEELSAVVNLELNVAYKN